MNGPPNAASPRLVGSVGLRTNRAYVIATAPRTGSSLLAEALVATRRAGNPDEFFDLLPKNEHHWVERYGVPEGANYIEHIVQESRTRNGVFGFKLHWHQIPALRRRLLELDNGNEKTDRRPLLGLLRGRFPDVRFVWLSRRNKVAQAISYYRAADSHVWRVWGDNRFPPVVPVKKPEFDRAEIQRYLKMVERQDAGWRKFFLEQKIPALVLIYEDFVQTYEHTVRGVLNFLGIPASGIALPPPGLRRMADTESEDWERRFREGPPQPRSTKSDAPGRPSAAASLPLIAYDVGSPVKTGLTPGGPTRAWMDATPRRFAYRCLPMVIANQWGWLIQTRSRVEAVWDGTHGQAGLVVTSPEGQPPAASSHFGSGILTFHVGYVFRTPPGYNLHVRGPANMPKDGVCALEGIIESDWTEATFTMNWKLTRPHHPVVFEAGEPIAMISPVRRGELERFVPDIQPLSANPELLTKFTEWSASRDSFNTNLRVSGSAAQKAGWQKDYTRGRTVHGEPVADHQTGLDLEAFPDRK